MQVINFDQSELTGYRSAWSGELRDDRIQAEAESTPHRSWSHGIDGERTGHRGGDQSACPPETHDRSHRIDREGVCGDGFAAGGGTLRAERQDLRQAQAVADDVYGDPWCARCARLGGEGSEPTERAGVGLRASVAEDDRVLGGAGEELQEVGSTFAGEGEGGNQRDDSC